MLLPQPNGNMGCLWDVLQLSVTYTLQGRSLQSSLTDNAHQPYPVPCAWRGRGMPGTVANEASPAATTLVPGPASLGGFFLLLPIMGAPMCFLLQPHVHHRSVQNNTWSLLQ